MSKKNLGVLGGCDMPESLVIRWAVESEVLLAADSGANILLRNGFEPTIIGDFDSVIEAQHLHPEKFIRDLDANTTDCDKLLAYAAKEGLASITIAGFEGDLFDHMLASLFSMSRSSLQVRIAMRRGIGWVIRPSMPAVIQTFEKQRVSLLPITRAEGVTLIGVQWELANQTLEPHGLISISNEATGGVVSASLESGTALLMVEFPEQAMPIW